MNSDTAQASGASWADLHGANALRSIALAGGVALHAINVYIATTILPSIIKDIGGLEYYAWNTTLFVVTSIVGSALSARLIQAWGPKAAYLLAVAVFSAGSVVSARALHALDAGGPQHPGTGRRRAVRAELCADPHRVRRGCGRARWRWCPACGVATLCGPAIGGIFAQTGHWRLAFWTLLPAARCWPSSWRPRWAASRR